MELYDYQRRLVERMKDGRSVCLSVGMGLGKTAAVLHYLEWLRVSRGGRLSAAIVAPKRVAETVWCQEADKWGLSHLRSLMVLAAGTAARRRKAIEEDEFPVKVISRDNVAELDGLSFDVLVIDELTSFKNMSAARTRAAMRVCARQRIGLTGTFAPNGMMDVYAQLAVLGLAPQDDRHFYAWRGMFFEDVLRGKGLRFSRWKLRRGVTEEEVLEQWRGSILTMTTDDYLRLPDIVHRRIPLELTGGEREAYDGMVSFMHFPIPDTCEEFAVTDRQKLAKVRTLASGFVYDSDGSHGGGAVRVRDGGSRVRAAVDFCLSAREEGEAVLFFHVHRETADWFLSLANAEGLRCARVGDGGWLERWNSGVLDVLVANHAGAVHGLNLQHGGHIILWAELTWNYEFWAQANARLHRTGQKEPVQVWRMVARGTVDENIERAIAAKERCNSAVEKATK